MKYSVYKIRTASLLTGLSDFDFTRFEDFKNIIIFYSRE